MGFLQRAAQAKVEAYTDSEHFILGLSTALSIEARLHPNQWVEDEPFVRLIATRLVGGEAVAATIEFDDKGDAVYTSHPTPEMEGQKVERGFRTGLYARILMGKVVHKDTLK